MNYACDTVCSANRKTRAMTLSSDGNGSVARTGGAGARGRTANMCKSISNGDQSINKTHATGITTNVVRCGEKRTGKLGLSTSGGKWRLTSGIGSKSSSRIKSPTNSSEEMSKPKKHKIRLSTPANCVVNSTLSSNVSSDAKSTCSNEYGQSELSAQMTATQTSPLCDTTPMSSAPHARLDPSGNTDSLATVTSPKTPPAKISRPLNYEATQQRKIVGGGQIIRPIFGGTRIHATTNSSSTSVNAIVNAGAGGVRRRPPQNSNSSATSGATHSLPIRPGKPNVKAHGNNNSSACSSVVTKKRPTNFHSSSSSGSSSLLLSNRNSLASILNNQKSASPTPPPSHLQPPPPPPPPPPPHAVPLQNHPQSQPALPINSEIDCHLLAQQNSRLISDIGMSGNSISNERDTAALIAIKNNNTNRILTSSVEKLSDELQIIKKQLEHLEMDFVNSSESQNSIISNIRFQMELMNASWTKAVQDLHNRVNSDTSSFERLEYDISYKMLNFEKQLYELVTQFNTYRKLDLDKIDELQHVVTHLNDKLRLVTSNSDTSLHHRTLISNNDSLGLLVEPKNSTNFIQTQPMTEKKQFSIICTNQNKFQMQLNELTRRISQLEKLSVHSSNSAVDSNQSMQSANIHNPSVAIASEQHAHSLSSKENKKNDMNFMVQSASHITDSTAIQNSREFSEGCAEVKCISEADNSLHVVEDSSTYSLQSQLLLSSLPQPLPCLQSKNSDLLTNLSDASNNMIHYSNASFLTFDVVACNRKTNSSTVSNANSNQYSHQANSNVNQQSLTNFSKQFSNNLLPNNEFNDEEISDKMKFSSSAGTFFQISSSSFNSQNRKLNFSIKDGYDYITHANNYGDCKLRYLTYQHKQKYHDYRVYKKQLRITRQRQIFPTKPMSKLSIGAKAAVQNIDDNNSKSDCKATAHNSNEIFYPNFSLDLETHFDHIVLHQNVLQQKCMLNRYLPMNSATITMTTDSTNDSHRIQRDVWRSPSEMRLDVNSFFEERIHNALQFGNDRLILSDTEIYIGTLFEIDSDNDDVEENDAEDEDQSQNNTENYNLETARNQNQGKTNISGCFSDPQENYPATELIYEINNHEVDCNWSYIPSSINRQNYNHHNLIESYPDMNATETEMNSKFDQIIEGEEFFIDDELLEDQQINSVIGSGGQISTILDRNGLKKKLSEHLNLHGSTGFY